VYIVGTSFKDGAKLVVTGPGSDKTLEVKTITPTNSKLPEGTYVCGADQAALGVGTGSVVYARRFGCRDRLAKARSASGWLVLLPAVAGLIAASATGWAVLSPNPSPGVDPDRVQAALSWAAEPVRQINSQASPAEQQDAATDLQHRSDQVQLCVQSMRGALKPVTHLPPISCAPNAQSWLQRNFTAVSAVGAVVSALCATGVAFRRTGFQQSL